jgi:catabolite regulation protein CreA
MSYQGTKTTMIPAHAEHVGEIKMNVAALASEDMPVECSQMFGVTSVTACLAMAAHTARLTAAHCALVKQQSDARTMHWAVSAA